MTSPSLSVEDSDALLKYSSSYLYSYNEKNKDNDFTAGRFQYQLRGLGTDTDVKVWTQFCAECFSYKPNPPSSEYFERHFFNDPKKDPKLIRVMTTLSQNTNCGIVSSVRIFRRLISTGGNGILKAGGIGEVCTLPFHRKRGLAKALLMNALLIMSSEEENMECSLLHASPSLMPVYENSGGYVSVPSKWSLITLKRDIIFSNEIVGERDGVSLSVRLAQFPKDTKRLYEIHQVYSERRFAGCIIRSMDYWNEYLRFEIGESMYVFTYNNKYSTVDEGDVISWLSIRPRNGRYQLRDFGIDLQLCDKIGLSIHSVMKELLASALKQCCENATSSVVTSDHQLLLHLPTPIVHDIQDARQKCSWIDWSKQIVEEDENGWMYKSLPENVSSFRNNDETVKRERDMAYLVETLKRSHLIWPADSF